MASHVPDPCYNAQLRHHHHQPNSDRQSNPKTIPRSTISLDPFDDPEWLHLGRSSPSCRAVQQRAGLTRSPRPRHSPVTHLNVSSPTVATRQGTVARSVSARRAFPTTRSPARQLSLTHRATRTPSTLSLTSRSSPPPSLLPPPASSVVTRAGETHSGTDTAPQRHNNGETSNSSVGENTALEKDKPTRQTQETADSRHKLQGDNTPTIDPCRWRARRSEKFTMSGPEYRRRRTERRARERREREQMQMAQRRHSPAGTDTSAHDAKQQHTSDRTSSPSQADEPQSPPVEWDRLQTAQKDRLFLRAVAANAKAGAEGPSCCEALWRKLEDDLREGF